MCKPTIKTNDNGRRLTLTSAKPRGVTTVSISDVSQQLKRRFIFTCAMSRGVTSVSIYVVNPQLKLTLTKDDYFSQEQCQEL